jgi:hypothetical protein
MTTKKNNGKKQIPFGDDNQKNNQKNNGKNNGTAKYSGLSTAQRTGRLSAPSVEMTLLFCCFDRDALRLWRFRARKIAWKGGFQATGKRLFE